MTNIKKQLTIFTSSLSLFLINSRMALAQVTNPVTGKFGEESAGQKGSNFFNYLFLLWQTGISIGGLVVLGMYIMGAFEWITSGDDPKGAEKGRNRIMNATIGLIILVSAFTIVNFVSHLLFGDEFNIFEINLPTANPQKFVPNITGPDPRIKK